MRLPLVLLALLAAPVATAQTSDSGGRPAGGSVSGYVRDSIGRAPLAGAMVQLVGANSAARFGMAVRSDSSGRYTLADVPNGHYRLAFFHPLLDSLGVEAPIREVSVDGPGHVRADLAVPSAARLRAAFCESLDSSGVVIGIVRSATDHSPMAGVEVTGEWAEFSLSHNRLTRVVPRLVAITGANGWFAICNVPPAGTIALRASLGADSTDVLELQMPENGLLRRELYLGEARKIAVRGTQLVEGGARPQVLHGGNGHILGMVVNGAGLPVGNAQVRIVGGPQTQTNNSGEWSLFDAPSGTRTLEVRAVGYTPERLAVDVVEGVEPVRVILPKFRTVLDTMRVTASRLKDRNLAGFEERRHNGGGQFITAQDIERRAPVRTSNVLQNVQGVAIGNPLNTCGESRRICVRGSMSTRGNPMAWCAAAIYLDGQLLRSVSADDLDIWVHPEEVAGIEIYPGTSVPQQFQPPGGVLDEHAGCGSVIVWTK